MSWKLQPGDVGFPECFAVDPRPPSVIHGRGDPTLLAPGVPRVAIVGARKCTYYGRSTADTFGRDLAASGVSVVSGLALGIDGAAHRGALSVDGAPPVGVVGSGLRVVYPRRHADLWEQVAERGCLISEAEPDARAESWRFPMRNRLIAALADVVLVVEAHPDSGTRHTVDAAVERGRTVMAVPGPVSSPASKGSNQLLREGCAPACDVTDVLVTLGLSGPGQARLDLRPPPAPEDDPVLAALDWGPASLDQVVERCGLPLGRVSAALYRLKDAGWARATGVWWQRAAPE
jgi:DNA processing protein